jgi:1-acyl-sn-glycerol-3-phosphate acyltransferase
MAVYATFLTNYFGLKLKKVSAAKDKKRLRTEYSKTLLNRLNIEVELKNPEKIPPKGQFLLISNHRSVIDPILIEAATEHHHIFGHWISKKELYDSFFFGLFVKNAGTVLLDRDAKQMSGFFADIKKCVKAGDSIYLFPEGTRSKDGVALGKFQGGAQLIAMKNRLPILPLFISTQANDVLKASLQDGKKKQKIVIEVGDIIDYKDRSRSLEENYREQFHITA